MSVIPPGLALPAARLALGAAGSALGALREALSPEKQKARKTAEDFEAMFLENMLAQVYPQEAGEGPAGDNGIGGSVYRGMMVSEQAKSIAKAGGVGIADQIYRQMLQLQERQEA